MDESFLTRVAVVCSVAGLVALFLLSNSTTSAIVPIGELTAENVGIVTRVCGNITNKYTSKQGHIFFHVTDRSGGIDVVVFNNSVGRVGANPHNLSTGNRVCILGRVDIYKNRIEMLPRDIELV